MGFLNPLSGQQILVPKLKNCRVFGHHLKHLGVKLLHILELFSLVLHPRMESDPVRFLIAIEQVCFECNILALHFEVKHFGH